VESNGSLPPGLTVTCGLTACTSGSAPGPTLGIEYGKPLPFTFFILQTVVVAQMLSAGGEEVTTAVIGK